MPTPFKTVFVLAAAGLVATSGCASGPAPSAPAAPRSPAPVELRDADWAQFNSHRFQLSLALPDGKAWRIDDHSTEWLEATHPSNTLFRARVWSEHELVTPEACEKKVRYWVPDLPKPSGEDIVDERDLPSFPAKGFTSHLIVGLATPPGAAPPTVGGVALAIGASEHKCVVLMFTSLAHGAASAASLASRLELGSRIIEGAVLKSDTLPGREPFQAPTP